MQTHAQVCTCDHLRIFVGMQPNLPDIYFLVKTIPLSKNLVKHCLLGSSSCYEHLDLRRCSILIYQIQGLHQDHEVLVWCVTCTGQKQSWSILITKLRQSYLYKKCLFVFSCQTFELTRSSIVNHMYKIRVYSCQFY